VSQATTPNQHREQDTVEKEIRITVASGKLTAWVDVPWPAEGQKPPNPEDIKNALQKKNIAFGIDEKAVNDIVNNSIFDKDVVVARGKDPVSGNDARLIFKFDKVQELKPKEDAEGRIDYKDIDFVQNATRDQVLVEKVPPTEGVPGTDVFGEPVSARSGRDVKLPAGPNTKASEDGLKLLAAIDGAVVYAGKMVKINDVHTIGGDICAETGNIRHNGSLIIRGKVDSGFEVIAKGDIEVAKNVDDAKIVSGGNIMVKGGFLGSRSGFLKAAGDIHCKYINDQIVDAGGSVYIGGEAFNSLITAKDGVFVSGQKGRIVGGGVMAGDEIKATCLGSDAGTRTELQVAYDARLMKQYNEIVSESKALDENAERVKEGLYVFYRLQMDNKLTTQKQKALEKLEEFKKNLPKAKEELQAKREAIEMEIQKNKRARIVAAQKVYPGVVLQFGIIYKEITDEMGPTIFQLEGAAIIRKEYKPGKDDS